MVISILKLRWYNNWELGKNVSFVSFRDMYLLIRGENRNTKERRCTQVESWVCCAAPREAVAVEAQSTGAVRRHAAIQSARGRCRLPSRTARTALRLLWAPQLRALPPPAPQCFVASLERSQRCVKSRARVGGCVPLPASIEVTDTSRLCR